jgi:hypothetical protein
MSAHRISRALALAGALAALATLIAIAAGGRLPVWAQLAESVYLVAAFAGLYWAELLMHKQDLLILDLGTTVNELLEENRRAGRAIADYLLIAQLRSAFGGRVPHRTGPQSLLCPSCARADCPGIRGVDLCPSWQEAEERNARGEYLPTFPSGWRFEIHGGPAGPVEHTDPEETTP